MYLWPEGVSRNLWPYALKYVCDIRNKFRYHETLTPENLFSGVSSFTPSNVSQLHPFGCPVYVLDDRLQGENKIPRWEPRSRVAVYLGHSPHHAQSVALVLNLSTGHVSPQFHLVFDDNFTTISHLKLGTVPTNWPELYETNRELVTEETFQLNKEWMNQATTQPSVQWLSAAIDSQPTTFSNLLDSSTSLFSHEADPLDDNLHVSQNEGVHIGQNEGAHIEQNEETFQNLDPLTGDDSSPHHYLQVNFDASLQMPEVAMIKETEDLTKSGVWILR
jgi:hypothetical protein